MNSSTYMFGGLSSGYSQYPEDGSSNLFKDVLEQCVAESQLIIHRDENLMYYVYVRKFDEKKYIGFAIVLNKYYFTLIQPLFSLFEKAVESLLEKGVIINFTPQGEITSALPSLASEEEEVMSVVNALQRKVNKLKGQKRLPPVDYSVAITSRKLFKDSDSLSEIVNASCRFGFTVVLKESDYDTVRTTSFKNIIKNQAADRNVLLREIEELKASNRRILRQKRQFNRVILLVAIVILCSVGLFWLYDNLNVTQNELVSANNTISEKESIISNRDYTITALQDSVFWLKDQLNGEIREKEKAESSLRSMCAYSPFAVTKCEVSANQFGFNYFSPVDKKITVTLTAICEEDGETVSNSHSISLNKGSGAKSLKFSRQLEPAFSYYVMLIFDGHIVAGKHW